MIIFEHGSKRNFTVDFLQTVIYERKESMSVERSLRTSVSPTRLKAYETVGALSVQSAAVVTIVCTHLGGSKPPLGRYRATPVADSRSSRGRLMAVTAFQAAVAIARRPPHTIGNAVNNR